MSNTRYRKLTASEIELLEHYGNSAECWDWVEVSEGFHPEQIRHSRLEGKVCIGEGSNIYGSLIKNYRIGAHCRIEQVSRLECRHESRFGNGVMVATMNECEGRQVMLYERLSAQTAYMLALFRHRPNLIRRLETMIEAYAEERRSTMGEVGDECRLIGARFLREVRIGNRVTIDGASALECATLCDDVEIGVDVKGYEFIAAEGARIRNGVILERCFVGEGVILDKAFSAGESLFFANSHCENGEAASIFAGPYTVSHHKSSLLIAGMFSFFNAGSGSNQSNHLFKSGAVHQSVHRRGCKFASGAYIMSPALEGAFTMVLGHHSYHHDTSAFPYSYLIEKEGRSMLMPGANLTSYGAVRDIEKWPKRDKRRVKRDRINFEEYNPYICQSFIEAVNVLNTLQDADPDAGIYDYNKVFIKANLLRRGLKLYHKAIVASLGYMLSKGGSSEARVGRGRWIDMAGQYLCRERVEELLDRIEGGEVASLEEVELSFDALMQGYDDYAHDWALGLYAELLGHAPTREEVEELVVAGRNAHETMRQTTEKDRQRDCSLEMAVSYGLDSNDPEIRKADYMQVRGLK